MTPILQSITNKVKLIPEVLDFKIYEVPNHLLEQVSNKNCLMFQFLIRIENGIETLVNFVVPSVIYNDENSHYFPIGELIHSGRDRIKSPEAIGPSACYLVESSFKNIGVTTYYVKPNDQFLVRLIEKQPNVISPDTPELKNLYDILMSIPKVFSVRFEDILDDNLKYDEEDYILITCKVDIELDTTKKFRAIVDGETEVGGIIPFNFILPESVYNDTSLHQSAVQNLINWIDSIEKNDNGEQDETGTV